MEAHDRDSHDFDGVRAIFFDFMGTCLDWHANVVNRFPDRIDQKTKSALAIAWREAFFKDIHDRFEQGLLPEDVDVTHARLMKALLDEPGFSNLRLSESEQEDAVKSWHQMRAWNDVPPALDRLREKYEVFVLANGTTRLQLDLTKSSGLKYDLLFSSQLLDLTKPDLEIYRKAMKLVGVEPQEALMVAAHAYDLRAAKEVGMKTVYVRRWSEDTMEHMKQVQRDVDAFLGGTGLDPQGTGNQSGQLTELADLMCGIQRRESEQG